MSFISPITNRINAGMKACYNYCLKKPDMMLSRTQFLDKACQKFQDPKANAAWIAGLGVASVILKDGFGCYLYVKQSLNNKKIPNYKKNMNTNKIIDSSTNLKTMFFIDDVSTLGANVQTDKGAMPILLPFSYEFLSFLKLHKDVDYVLACSYGFGGK